MAVMIGELKRLISLQVNTPTLNAFGEEIDSWAEITQGAVWAAVKYLRGFERVGSGQEASFGEALFTIRYRTGLTTQHRIVYDGDTYDILEVRDTGPGAMLEIVARKRTD